MSVNINYKYLNSPNTHSTYQFQFEQPDASFIARSKDEVCPMIDFAEDYQRQGFYVVVYLPYEAAPAFNSDLVTYEPSDSVYGACYVFKEPVQHTQANTVSTPSSDSQFQFKASKASIIESIETIQREITEGNTYQVNYTTRLSRPISQGIADIYHALSEGGHGSYTVMIDTDDVKVASISPELFFQKGTYDNQPNTILSRPMKGTMPRGTSPETDQANYDTLAQSLKDRAENVMIVDLLRNDISRIAKPGTIDVDLPFFIETFETVYQMTSIVKGTLRQGTSLHTILKALFPCGSITGAPKINTMSIIHQLEQTPRHAYCGTIGLLLPDTKMIFNVPIRTVQYIYDEAVYGVGAGITIDSDPNNEYDEFQAKTSILKGI
ncbi:anthranilate synthase component I family protein [Staphylococcus massiliensis]|uniref:Para-aminobenzoate synthase component n=1 Tax=Staphylococcus massiliensis S46 TaxID=1229783 RepID=K9AML8_9STAP|nr:anthranilate synthase component I family protein [Staphylococcus massiliensis]EKU48554.1 para-aminobenzoate synthase component [Staphylococcus massiliensis S46]MCG3400107.1 anthranilate synthase component I family protein [Staphylococcus massiliensis]MCG3401829.1 anthranilate synthase component I family protein [Staphylococcus massiliensis]MCG3413161.1 anthranilate synthase component I family protein [Staphylococcus massiliensis]POA00606.1 anthranilate synthase component I family protein [S